MKTFDQRTMSDLERAQVEAFNREKKCVLDQPHRRGSTSELRSEALGRFVEDRQCGIECYNAGNEYMILVYKWRMANGIRVPVWVREEFGGAGADLSGDALSKFIESVAEWKREIKRCETALKAAGASTYTAAQAMIFEDADPCPRVWASLKRALLQLAIDMGKFPC